MEVFRKTAKPLIIVVAVSFFAWLVLDLSGLTGGTGLLTRTSVGKINGRAVDIRLYQEAVAEATQARQRESPEPLGFAQLAQIRDQVWERLIQERILEAEYRRWGLSVTPEEVAAAIRSFPPQEFYSMEAFQTDGQFDLTRYQRWLTSTEGQNTVPLLEAQYRSRLLQEKLARYLVSAMAVSDAALWERFRDESETAQVGVVTIVPADAVSDAAVSVTPTEVEEYYRTNREEFRREKEVWLSFVLLDRTPDASDTAAAVERARQLRAEILGGTPFADVAARESVDTATARRGGDLGEWTRGQFVPAFDAVAFSIPLQTVSEPVVTPFGVHLIEVTWRSGNKARGRHILLPIEVTGTHRDVLDARADTLERLAAERLDPAALDTAARALGLQIHRAGPVSRARMPSIPPDAAVWALQAVEGEHSPVIEMPDQYYVFRVDSLHPAGIPPLAAVRGLVEAKVRDRAKLAHARRMAEDLRAQAVQASAGGRRTGLEHAARAMALPYQVVGPFTRINAPFAGGEAVGAAFALAPGQVSGVVETGGVVYVFQGIARTPADSTDFANRIATLREQALEHLRTLYLQQYLTALRQRATVVDERDRVFRTAAQIAAETGLPY
jgi:peptidyl-prolyl cis-trans isomerase D